MKRIIITLVSIILVVLAFGQTTYKNNGEVRLAPRLMNYQGYLTDTLGNPITNPSVSVTFGIWSSSGGGTQLWFETQPISVSKGIFSVILGTITPIPDSVFTKSTDRWLELNYAGITLSPRTRITAAGYALSATYADTAFSVVNNAITTPKIQDTAVTLAKIAPAGAAAGQVIKWSGAAWTPSADIASSDTDWVITGSNMYSGVSGNVGIGTGDPGAVLTVNGTGSNYGNGIRITNGANYWEGVHDGLGGLTFGYSGSDKFVISRSGNSYFTSGKVGVLTANPAAAFAVSTGDDRKQFVIDPFVDAYTVRIGMPDWYGVGQLAIVNGAERMRIDQNGNIGIGTATPNAKLDVAGNIYAGTYPAGVADINAYSLELGGPAPTGTNEQATLLLHHHGNIAHQLRYASGSLFLEAAGNGYGTTTTPTFQVDGSLYAAINGGNVGIGTTSPSNLLHVNGTTRTNGLVIPTGAASGYVLTSDAGGVASWQAPTVPTHNHLGQLWTSTTAGMGLGVDLNVNYSSSVYGKYVKVTNTATSGWTYGGYFNVTAAGSGICGVCCVDSAPAGSATNIYGTYIDCHQAGTGSAYGGRFYALSTGTGGVYGINCEAAGSGTSYRYGVYSTAVAPAGSSNSAYGVYATTTHNGTGESYGGRFTVNNYGTGTRRALYGVANAPSGSSNPALSINGDCNHAGTGPAYGAYFAATGAGSGTKYGVYAEASGSGTLWAGYFSGNVEITGSHGFANGFFVIDHPLDPKNMILRHNIVESPENLCLYRGKVKLNSSGEGRVTMPSYFKALTKETEATVTLTSIGRPFNTGYDWNSDYTVCTVYGEANREVSYIVMADRDDPVMRQLYKPVEEEKGNGNFTKGKLLYPKAYGYPEEMGENYEMQKEVARTDAGK